MFYAILIQFFDAREICRKTYVQKLNRTRISYRALKRGITTLFLILKDIYKRNLKRTLIYRLVCMIHNGTLKESSTRLKELSTMKIKPTLVGFSEK